MTNKYDSSEIIHVKEGKLEYLKFRLLEKYNERFTHAITLRHGGVSDGEYTSLNFRSKGNDSRENVLTNLNLICESMKINSNNVFKASQNHTDNILVLNDKNKNDYTFDKFNEDEYDGYVTNCCNISTLITTADCNPIILYDPIKNAVANVHSGWKGTIKQIYIKAVNIMKNEFDCNTSDIIACIGPSINKCCFDSEEAGFKEKFTSVWKNEEEYIYYEKENKKRFHIDLPYIIKKDLIGIGLSEKNISLSNICTCCNSNDFFSYRRNTKDGKKEYGTGATIVMLNDCE